MTVPINKGTTGSENRGPESGPENGAGLAMLPLLVGGTLSEAFDLALFEERASTGHLDRLDLPVSDKLGERTA